MSRELKANVAGALALGLALLVTGCGQGGSGGPPDTATEVMIERPSVIALEDAVSAVGTIEANERVELKPEASGLLQRVRFVEGQHVKQGDLLFELDSQKEAATVAQAEAEEQLAQANVDRARILMGTKAISRQELDQLASQVAVKTAVKRLEQERLSDRRVVAPFDGVVGPRLVSPGQYVMAGAPLGTLVDGSRLKVRFRLPERQLGVMRQGQSGRVRVSAYPDRVFNGEVDLINPEVDESTRTVEARLIVPNPDGALKPGMFARVELLVGTREKALVVPEAALVPSLDQFSVYAVEDGRARLRPVRVGLRLPGKAEVLEGLAPDQPIVVSGTQKLVDGMKVAPAKPVAAAQLPAAG